MSQQRKARQRKVARRAARGLSSGGRRSTELSTIQLSSIAPQVVRWLWRDRIALGKLTLLVGHPGQTKSIATVDIAARVTTSAPFPDAPDTPVPQGRVIMMNAEDDPSDTLRPRMDAAGGDPALVEVLDFGGSVTGRGTQMVRLDKQITRLRRLIKKRGDVRLVVVDPLSAFLSGTDTHRDAAVREVLGPLSMLAGDTNVAVVGIMHLSKARGSTLTRVGGSIGFVGAARAVLAIGVDPRDPDRRILAPTKSNATRKPLSLGYRIEEVEVPGAGEQPRIVWDATPCDVTADDAVGASEAESGGSELTFAGAWLRHTLRDGPVLSNHLKTEAQQAGIAPATLQRAAKAIGVRARKIGSQWYRTLERQRNEGGAD